MVDLIFSMLAIGFFIVATLAAVATATSVSPTLRNIAGKTVDGSVAFALMSALLAVWFLVRA
jgi:hypothetical protein